jgi:hypothetical protein
MRLKFLFLLLGMSAAGVAHADIFKCVDDAGRTTYMNEKPTPSMKNCTLMSREQPVNTVPTQRKASATPTPAGFPKVDEATQKSRDNDRRKILEQELDTEVKAMEAAKKELSEQEAVRLGDEKNYQKYLDRIQTYKDKVALHERNADAIRKEIANLK